MFTILWYFVGEGVLRNHPFVSNTNSRSNSRTIFLSSFMLVLLQAVEPTNKRYLLAIDVSGSMSCGNCNGTTITPRVASAAMAMLTARTEPQYHFVGFSHHLVPLNINSAQKLDRVIRTIEQVS